MSEARIIITGAASGIGATIINQVSKGLKGRSFEDAPQALHDFASRASERRRAR